MSLNLNKVQLAGRLTADPELKQTQNGIAVTTFTLAVNRRFSGKDSNEPQADFINITAWRQTAEFITRYFRKGNGICICGSIQTRKWTDNEQKTRYSTEVVADEAYFVESKNEKVGGGQQMSDHNAPAPSAQETAQPAAQFEAPAPDEDLPF